MAQKKRKAPVKRRQRTWTIPKLLLILGYGVIFAVLGVIFLMRQELLRVGIFGDKKVIQTPAVPSVSLPQTPTVSPRSAPLESPQTVMGLQRQAETPRSATSPPSRQSGEITAEEKQALDEILRSKR